MAGWQFCEPQLLNLTFNNIYINIGINFPTFRASYEWVYLFKCARHTRFLNLLPPLPRRILFDCPFLFPPPPFLSLSQSDFRIPAMPINLSSWNAINADETNKSRLIGDKRLKKIPLFLLRCSFDLTSSNSCKSFNYDLRKKEDKNAR